MNSSLNGAMGRASLARHKHSPELTNAMADSRPVIQTFHALPREIRQKIFGFLPQGELIGNVAIVCRAFREDVKLRSLWRDIDYSSLLTDVPDIPIFAKLNFLTILGSNFVEEAHIPVIEDDDPSQFLTFLANHRQSLRVFSAMIYDGATNVLFSHPFSSLRELALELVISGEVDSPLSVFRGTLSLILKNTPETIEKIQLAVMIEDFDVEDSQSLVCAETASKPHLTDFSVVSLAGNLSMRLAPDGQELQRIFPKLENLHLVNLHELRTHDLRNLLLHMSKLRSLIVNTNTPDRAMWFLTKSPSITPDLERLMLVGRGSIVDVLKMDRLFESRPALKDVLVGHCNGGGGISASVFQRVHGVGIVSERHFPPDDVEDFMLNYFED